MMAVCPECGKRHVVSWPELSPFRRGDDYYCSPKCYEVSVRRDLTKIKQVALTRRQRKNMKLKKDGTPAKKPGRKPQKQIEIPAGEFKPAVDLSAPAKKVEKPEGNMTVIATKEPPQVPTVKVDGPLKIETPETGNVEVVCTMPNLEYEVSAIRTEEFGEFYYDKKFNSIDWRTAEGDEISLHPLGWKNLMNQLPEILRVLGVEV